MRTKRRLVVRATTLAAAFIASAVPVTNARATVPPTSTVPADTETLPTDQGQQVTESWALTPAVSADPDAAGNRSELTYLADPGAVIQDAVTVFNFGTVQENFQVYATDAFNNNEGQFDVLPADKKPSDVGTWVKFSQEGITVPPGKQATIPITITIPRDAAPGDHVGAIVASSPTSGTDALGNVVTFDRRTGSRMYVRVNGPLTAELAVTNVDTTYDHSISPLGGTARVKYRIENRGNVRLAGTATLSVAGPLGIGEKQVALPNMPELLPGQDITVTADVHDVPELFLGFTTVRVEPAQPSGVDAKVSEKRDLSFVPPLAVLGVLLVALIALLVWRRVRRRRADGPASASSADTPLRRDRVLEHQST
jgi:hypothetical protein